MKDAGLRVRVEKELRDQFIGTCRQQGVAAAAVLRDFMRDYVVRESGGRQSSLIKTSGQRAQLSDRERG